MPRVLSPNPIDRKSIYIEMEGMYSLLQYLSGQDGRSGWWTGNFSWRNEEEEEIGQIIFFRVVSRILANLTWKWSGVVWGVLLVSLTGGETLVVFDRRGEGCQAGGYEVLDLDLSIISIYLPIPRFPHPLYELDVWITFKLFCIYFLAPRRDICL